MTIAWVLAAMLAAGDPLQPIFEKAVAALAAGDYASAEQGFERVLQSAPKHVGALGNLGVVYSRTNRPAKAIEVYRRALAFSPKDAGLLLNLGLVYLKQDRHAEALPLFAQVAAADPNSVQARELLATCRMFTGQVDPAVRSLESLPRTAGVLYLLGMGYLKQQQKEKARQAFDDLLAAASPPQANFLLGRAYYESGQFEQAAESLRATLELDPSFPGARRELGKACLSLRSNEEAEQQLRLALEKDPQDAEAAHFLGGLLVLNGRAAEALPHLEEARQSNPDSWSALYYLGRARLEMNQPEQAAELLQRAAERNPGEAAVYYQLGRALKAVGRDNESRKAFERFSQLKAGSSPTRSRHFDGAATKKSSRARRRDQGTWTKG